MWQFYTERAKRVVQLAHQEAANMGHTMVEPDGRRRNSLPGTCGVRR